MFVYVNNEMVRLLFSFLKLSSFVDHFCRYIFFLFLNSLSKSVYKPISHSVSQSVSASSLKSFKVRLEANQSFSQPVSQPVLLLLNHSSHQSFFQFVLLIIHCKLNGCHHHQAQSYFRLTWLQVMVITTKAHLLLL